MNYQKPYKRFYNRVKCSTIFLLDCKTLPIFCFLKLHLKLNLRHFDCQIPEKTHPQVSGSKRISFLFHLRESNSNQYFIKHILLYIRFVILKAILKDTNWNIRKKIFSSWWNHWSKPESYFIVFFYGGSGKQAEIFHLLSKGSVHLLTNAWSDFSGLLTK